MIKKILLSSLILSFTSFALANPFRAASIMSVDEKFYVKDASDPNLQLTPGEEGLLRTPYEAYDPRNFSDANGTYRPKGAPSIVPSSSGDASAN